MRTSTRRRASLASTITLLTTAVAALAVLLTGLVAWQTVRSETEAQQRDELGRQAEILSRTPALSLPLLRRDQRLAGFDGVQLAILPPTGAPVGPASAVIDATTKHVLLSGHSLSASATLNSEPVMVEGRTTRDGGAVVLTQPLTVVHQATARIRQGLALPAAVGLLGAALTSVLLARRIARPVATAAESARHLSAGQRGLAIATDGPRELAYLATALNTLDTALRHSENRQHEFLMSVSHELRTPLTAARGYAEALADGVIEPADVAATGRILLGETLRVDRFVHDLLDLARLEADDFRLDIQNLDLDALIAEAAAVWSDRCEQHEVAFRTERPGSRLTLHSDGFRIRQIIDGLAENALRVTPRNKALVLAVRAHEHGVVLQVRDGGPGLTPQDAAVAFDRGALHARYRNLRPVGTGLGLAIVHRLVTRLGGTIIATGDAPEGGACFTITLPAQVPAQ